MQVGLVQRRMYPFFCCRGVHQLGYTRLASQKRSAGAFYKLRYTPVLLDSPRQDLSHETEHMIDHVTARDAASVCERSPTQTDITTLSCPVPPHRIHNHNWYRLVQIGTPTIAQQHSSPDSDQLTTSALLVPPLSSPSTFLPNEDHCFIGISASPTRWMWKANSFVFLWARTYVTRVLLSPRCLHNRFSRLTRSMQLSLKHPPKRPIKQRLINQHLTKQKGTRMYASIMSTDGSASKLN